jgi:hypothetical protein
VVDLSIRFRRVHQRWLKMYRIEEKDADRVALPTHGFSVREQTPENIGKTAFSDAMGADAGAVETKIGRFPPDLQALIDAWPALPEARKAGILAMVKAAAGPTAR